MIEAELEVGKGIATSAAIFMFLGVSVIETQVEAAVDSATALLQQFVACGLVQGQR